MNMPAAPIFDDLSALSDATRSRILPRLAFAAPASLPAGAEHPPDAFT